MEEMNIQQRVDCSLKLLVTVNEMLQNVSAKDVSGAVILQSARGLADTARRILNEEE